MAYQDRFYETDCLKVITSLVQREKNCKKILLVGSGQYEESTQSIFPAAQVYKAEMLEELCFEPDYFDLLIADRVLERLKEQETALAEWLRVLKSGGILLTSFTNVRYQKVMWNLLQGHYQLFGRYGFTRKSFLQLLEKAALGNLSWYGVQGEAEAAGSRVLEELGFDNQQGDLLHEFWCVRGVK